MTFNEYYRLECAKLANQNIYNIQEDAKNAEKTLLLKLNNHISRTMLDVSVDELLVRIQEDFVFASMFAKTSARSGMSEKTQIEFMNAKGMNIENLSANAMRIADKLTCKSLDFYSPKTDTYFMAKVTNQRGGGQDNQFKDLKDFIVEANKVEDKKFVVIADGDYYRAKEMNEMMDMANSNVSISNSDLYSE